MAPPSGISEEYQTFLDYDWSDERWQAHLQKLNEDQPAPLNQKQVLKQKKKWYKKIVDSDFDDSYEPPPPPTTSSEGGARSSYTPSPSPSPTFVNSVSDTGEQWERMQSKATICFFAYAVALLLSIAAVGQAFPAYQALVVLAGAFILEVLAKYGLKFSGEYLQKILCDPNGAGVMPMMLLTLLTPGLHPLIRSLALVAPGLTALMCISSIARHSRRLPGKVKSFFEPISATSGRYQILQKSADAEVFFGIVLIIGVFTVRAAPISALLFWNFMMMRYMMSPFTQVSFQKVDGVLNPILGNIPGIKQLYGSLKRLLYSFVDKKDGEKKTNFCSIL